MSETAFPINDLMRRKLQTSLVIISLTLCVASTLFLLLFAEKMGFGISLMIEGKLTVGFASVLSPFIIFTAILVFIVGAIIVSFLSFMMISQKIRDIGLIKAAGCPNDLVFGYFMTELLIIAILSCFLGIVLGILADLASTSMLSSLGFQISPQQTNLWLILLVFGLFFALALTFGVKPVINAVGIEPVKAISPTYYLGLSKEAGFKVTSKSSLAMRIALRNVYRHKSASIRVIFCLTAVFLLATVGIAGGIIADGTTKSWAEKAIGRDALLVAHIDVCNQYKSLLSKFYERKENPPINYTIEEYLITDEILTRLSAISNVSYVEPRLVLETNVKEIPGYLFDPETSATTEVGDNREGDSLIVGVEPTKVLNEWFLTGDFLQENSEWEAIVGDSLAARMFTSPLNQQIELFDMSFDIVGVCLDPINNGYVAYVPLKNLQNLIGISKPNVAIVKANASSNRLNVMNQLKTEVQSLDSKFEVVDLNEMLDKNLDVIDYIWSTIMFLPLFSLFAGSLCLTGYVSLSITEQRQEFGVLRALGGKPSTIVKIISGQSLVILLSSFAAGTALGMITTLLILVPEPLVTTYTVLEIALWMLTAMVVTFFFSLYPAIKFAKKPILELMTQT